MKEDIVFPKVTGVTIAIARKMTPEGEFDWAAYLINKNDFELTNVLISTKGYGHDHGEPQKTSVLRHLIQRMAPHSAAPIERVDPSVFHLVNEYWLSYYVGEMGKDIYDKKFIFLPETIVDQNISFIPELELEGVLHV